MNPGFHPQNKCLSRTRFVLSKHKFPALEASPFILGAIAITMWEALSPGPDRVQRVVDYLWCIPSAAMFQLATGYLVYHGFQNLRWEWYPIDPLTRAMLDLVRTYACCYILGLFGAALGFKMVFLMESYMQPYDPNSKIPMANWTYRTACVFLVMAYLIIILGLGILASRPLVNDRKRLKVLEDLELD